MMLENRRKSTASADPNRPRLRKAPGAGTTSTIDGDDTSNQQTKEGDDERPTLKRRDQPQN